jgi:DNA-binding XRE family transcriptional regulator
MKNEDNFKLNQKIIEIMTELGFSSSRFADFIGVSRPVISHIVAKRNNPSLEIVHKIVRKIPELGMEWTFDDIELDKELLTKIADRLERETILAGETSEVSTEQKHDEAKAKSIVRVVVFYSDNTYSEISPNGFLNI